MTPERYAEITRLCQAALELNASQRAAFLAQACVGDDELRSEVEALLAADDVENSFIDQPALNAAAHIFAHEQPSLIGKQLGNYQILQRLGAGGMGEVHLAEDARLKRKVALKLLPAAFTQEAERVRRFEREAQAASALNHPNILTIYDFGQSDAASGSLHYLVMEFIEGVTLRQRAIAVVRSPVHRQTNRRRARQGAPGRHSAPRHQAGKCDAAPGWFGQSVGFRAGEAASEG